jgi:hypothetical protein
MGEYDHRVEWTTAEISWLGDGNYSVEVPIWIDEREAEFATATFDEHEDMLSGDYDWGFEGGVREDDRAEPGMFTIQGLDLLSKLEASRLRDLVNHSVNKGIELGEVATARDEKLAKEFLSILREKPTKK